MAGLPDISVMYGKDIFQGIAREVSIESSSDYARMRIELDLLPQAMGRRGMKKTSLSLTAKKVIFNFPATIVLWEDGTKTVVKCDDRDRYDETTGLALCYMKKALGNKSRALNDALNCIEELDEEETK